MKRIILSLIASSALAALCACGGGGYTVSGGEKNSATSTTGLTAGNWSLTTTSQVGGKSLSINGYLSTSGSVTTLNATSGATCPRFSFVNPSVFTITTNGNNVTITSPAGSDGGILTITGTASYGTNLNGTYQITGEPSTNSCYGDQGTVQGVLIPQIQNLSVMSEIVESVCDTYGDCFYDSFGNPLYYPGTGLSTNTAILQVNLNQDATPVTRKIAGVTASVYPVSGSMAFTNSACYNTGTIDSTQSYIIGTSVNLVVNTDSGVSLPMRITMAGSSGMPNSTPVLYTIPSGKCDYYQVNGKGSLILYDATQYLTWYDQLMPQ